jgi:hypothetical protein
MRTDRTGALGTILLLAALIAADSTAAEIADSAKKQAAERADSAAPKDEADKNTVKPGSVMKKMFKDFRPGSCKAQAAPAAPNTSAGPRGDAAVSVCRP